MTLDALRGLTVLLAMMDHVKVQFVPDVHLLVPMTRMSTPSFIILFGAMIEIAYLSKLRGGLPEAKVRARMAVRLVTCAGLATLLTLAAMVSGNLEPAAGLKALFGLGPGRFNEIFLIYVALFAALLALLPLLARYGAVTIIALAALGWVLRPILAATYPEPAYLLNFIFGVGSGYGPALLPALTFLGFGMAAGEVLTGRRGPTLVIVLALIAVAVCLSELQFGVTEAGRRFLANRWLNNPGYYAVGILGCLTLGTILLLAERFAVLRKPLEGLAKIGTQTLFVYGSGNLALNLLPMFEMPRSVGLLVAGGFLCGLGALALIGPERRNALGLGLPALWGRTYGHLGDKVAGRLLAVPTPVAQQRQPN